MKETLKNLYTVMMCILIGLALVSALGLARGIRPRILVTSSMQPSVYKGSLVLLNINTSWDSLEEGNIIAFRTGKTEVMHRVTAVTEKGLILKPDNGKGESLVTKDMYVGKEVMEFPYIGEMIKPILQHGKTLVVIAAMAMMIMGCWSLGRKENGYPNPL